MPEETNQPETLRDRANALYAQIDGAKEELAALLAGNGRDWLPTNRQADLDALVKTIGEMQGPTVSDLLGRIAVLETSGARPDPDAVTAEVLRSRALIDEVERENGKLRDELANCAKQNDFLKSHIADQGAQLAQFCASGAAGSMMSALPEAWGPAAAERCEAELQQQHELLVHYRAIVHHLSAPLVPTSVGEIRADMTRAYAEANPLQAGGAPLGA